MRAPAACSIFALALVGALAAPNTHAQTTPAQPLPMLEPDQVHLGGSSCTASVPRELGRSSVRNLRLRVASQPGPRPSTLAVWSSGEHTVASRRIDRELGAPNSVALDQGLNVQVLAPVNGGRFLVLSVGALCSGGRTRGYSCVRAIGLDADGMPTGAAHAPEPSTQQFDVVSSATLRGVDGAPSWGGGRDRVAVGWREHRSVPPRPGGARDGGGAPDSNPRPERLSDRAADGRRRAGRGARFPGRAGDRPGRRGAPPFVRARARAAPPRDHSNGTRERPPELGACPRNRPRPCSTRCPEATCVGCGCRAATAASSTAHRPTSLPPAELPATPVFPALAVTRRSLTLTRTDLRGAAVGQPLVMARAAGRAITSWSWDGAALHVVWGARVGREWVI
jgi:hypothetical protein